MSLLKEVFVATPSQEVYYDLDGRMCFQSINNYHHLGWVVVEEGEGFARPASIYKSLCSTEQVIVNEVEFDPDSIECF